MKVSIEVDSKQYNGVYKLYDDGIIVVTLLPSWKQSTTMLGSSPASVMAKIMLREMVVPYTGN